MPETENTPNLEMRTCVTCGKTFYANLDDEKIRATNGIAPRRECYDCLCARMKLMEQRAKAGPEFDIMRIIKKFRIWIKFELLIASIASSIQYIYSIITDGPDFMSLPIGLVIMLFWIAFLVI